MSQAVTPRMLSGFTPLDALSPDNLKELAGKASEVQVKSGRNLFRAGEESAVQWFLVDGVVELADPDGQSRKVSAGTAAARTALESGSPARCTAIARSDVTAVKVDRNLLDMMLTWDQTGSYNVMEIQDDAAGSDDDWMTRMLQTEAFRRIPPANIQAIFMRMEPIGCSAGEVIIRQGEPGDYFYIIREGRCRVTRTTKTRPDGIVLAELGPGNSFGEEALLSDKPRNATVTMTTGGTVMRLSKGDFNELLNEPLQQWVDFAEAREAVGKGARWLDVRLPAEFEDGHIQGAMNLPLVFLRLKASQLAEGIEYIVYCDTGSRSSAGAFLLAERGFTTRVLRGGLAQVPQDALATGREG